MTEAEAASGNPELIATALDATELTAQLAAVEAERFTFQNVARWSLGVHLAAPKELRDKHVEFLSHLEAKRDRILEQLGAAAATLMDVIVGDGGSPEPPSLAIT